MTIRACEQPGERQWQPPLFIRFWNDVCVSIIRVVYSPSPQIRVTSRHRHGLWASVWLLVRRNGLWQFTTLLDKHSGNDGEQTPSYSRVNDPKCEFYKLFASPGCLPPALQLSVIWLLISISTGEYLSYIKPN